MINLNKLPNQERDEKTILFLRRHWLEVFEIVFIAAFMLSIPFIVIMIAQSSDIPIGEHPIFGPASAVLVSIYLFISLLIAMTQFTDYYLDTWIVTNERIINIEQKGLFSRIVSELHLNQVQDVTSETHGILATFLSYGNVHIQTAGARERFNFKQIDNPEEIKRIITKLVQEDKRRHGDASASGGGGGESHTPAAPEAPSNKPRVE